MGAARLKVDNCSCSVKLFILARTFSIINDSYQVSTVDIMRCFQYNIITMIFLSVLCVCFFWRPGDTTQLPALNKSARCINKGRAGVFQWLSEGTLFLLAASREENSLNRADRFLYQQRPRSLWCMQPAPSPAAAAGTPDAAEGRDTN